MSQLPVLTLAALLAASGPTAHLYVAGYARGALQIVRFPFVDGVPAGRPDLRYQNLVPPIGVGRDGTFYATVPLACCSGLGQIDVFGPDSNKPERQITLPNLNQDTTIVTAIAEGPGGFLYVGYAAFQSGAREPRAPRNAPLQGVAVYPPDANGGAPPVQMFDVPLDVAGPLALAFDPRGYLYIATTNSFDDHNRIYTVADALHDPHVIRELDLPYGVRAFGLEVSDGGRNLYAQTFGSPQAEIAVYPYGASGRARPARTIAIAQSSLGPVYGFGIAGPNAYVGLYANPAGVLGYEKHASGSPSPDYSLPLPNFVSIEGVAVGP